MSAQRIAPALWTAVAAAACALNASAQQLSNQQPQSTEERLA
jgi:hypothetical protein